MEKQTGGTMMRTYLRVALGAFLLAASTGVLLRFGLFQGMPAWAQNFSAVRHAHSHLMYFGWGTLAIMALIWQLLPRWTQAPLPRAVPWQMGLTAVAALLSFPAFWSNGYGLTQIGPAQLPLGAMISGINGLLWIFFVLLYWRATARLAERPLPVQLWDWALVMLLLAFGGALGLVGLIALDQRSVFLQQTMLHLFLETFATGWFTLALLGLLWAWLEGRVALPDTLPTRTLAFALAPTFFIGMSPTLLPPNIFWISAWANLIAALLLAWHVRGLWQRRHALPLLAWFALAALSVHILLAPAMLWPGVWRWSANTQLRIFYLHNLLLGWMSSGLLGVGLALWFPQVQASRRFIGGRLTGGQFMWRLIHVAWFSGVGIMLAALAGLGMVGVAAPLSALTWLQIAAWGSVIIAVSIGLILLRALLPADDQTESTQARASQEAWPMTPPTQTVH